MSFFKSFSPSLGAMFATKASAFLNQASSSVIPWRNLISEGPLTLSVCKVSSPALAPSTGRWISLMTMSISPVEVCFGLSSLFVRFATSSFMLKCYALTVPVLVWRGWMMWSSWALQVETTLTARTWSVQIGQGVRDVLDSPELGEAPPRDAEVLHEGLQTQRFGHYWRDLVFWAKSNFNCSPGADTPAQREVVRRALARRAMETPGMRHRHIAMHLERCVVLAFTPSIHELAAWDLDQRSIVQERRRQRRSWLSAILDAFPRLAGGLRPR